MSLEQDIRAALKHADDQGKLSVVSAVTGLPEEQLREIIDIESEMNIIDRYMLAIHLEI